MEFNSFIFPSPTSTYKAEEYNGEFVWIPNKEHFTYRDKIKYNNYKSMIVNTDDSLSRSKTTNKTVKNKSQPIIQRVPSISFAFENKFSTQILVTDSYIPCLYLKAKKGKFQTIWVYFHANHEDLGLTYGICYEIASTLRVNVLSVEYPG